MQNRTRGMDGVYPMVTPGREEKPRTRGLTMVIDMGCGLSATQDFVDYAGRYIDILKISSGTAALYAEDTLREKIKILKKAGIEVESGGSHFEVANWKGDRKRFYDQLLSFGFDVVEVADGHLPLSEKERYAAIMEANSCGLKVATEVGKKDPKENIKAREIALKVLADLDAGAEIITVEGKASGMDVGIFDEVGNIDEAELESVTGSLAPEVQDKLLWEAPLRLQQQALILRFGCNVNLGNIFPQEVFPLELMRNGLMLAPLIQTYKRENQE